MMVCRRRWRLEAFFILIGGLSPIAAFAAGSLPASAKDLEPLHGKAAVDLREKVLKAAPTDVILRDTYARNVANEFGGAGGLGVKSANPDARLNSAILIAQMASLSTDHA